MPVPAVIVVVAEIDPVNTVFPVVLPIFVTDVPVVLILVVPTISVAPKVV